MTTSRTVSTHEPIEGARPPVPLGHDPVPRADVSSAGRIELSRPLPSGPALDMDEDEGVLDHTLDRYARHDDPDLFAKCREFAHWTRGMAEAGVYQRLFRVTLTEALDHRATIFDPFQKRERVMCSFDSNSYLGLHRHPRVIAAVQQTLPKTGYGSPSAQMLSGTNRYLRQLEEKLSAFHGREDTLVFSTGYSANTGTLSALVRRRDAVICDRYAHASIHEGCGLSNAGFRGRFKHNDARHLAKVLARAEEAGALGKLVVTDGVFSMHGTVAPLPELLATCRQHGARLMVDDAHGMGVVGETGRGVEEHFGIEGQADVLMGTLSKSLGCQGGYVSGSKALIDYLRWFANGSLFTTAPPAALCAGVVEAVSVIEEEPEHHARMWANIRYFSELLGQTGLIVSQPESAIQTVYVGPQRLLWRLTRRLFDAGIKCGSVIYPAVPKDGTILRLCVTARHTKEDLEMAAHVLHEAGRDLGMLGLDREGLAARWGDTRA